MSVWHETWLRCECPECKSRNWIYETHSDRSFPARDNFALKCFKCGACHWLSEDDRESAEVMYGEGCDIEDIAVEGRETP